MLVCLFVVVLFSFKGMWMVEGREFHCFGEEQRKKERKKRALATGYNLNMWCAKYPCVCRKPKLSGIVVHTGEIREKGRR